MTWDIYGNPLKHGHCEVHPDIAQEYPCSICMAERRQHEYQDNSEPEPTAQDYAELRQQHDQLQTELFNTRQELEAMRQQVKNLTSDSTNTGKMLNRRVEIENHLLMIYQGVMPLPNQQDCKVLALRLGTPKEHWGDYLKQYEFIQCDNKAVH